MAHPTGRAARRRASVPLAALLLALASPPVLPAEVTLYEVQVPEKGAVDVPFVATDRAPAGATLEAELRSEGASTRISLAFRKMKPAVLFGGDVTSYAVWTVTRDGSVENLGELFVREAKGEASFSTRRTAFALLVTAEPWIGAARPSGIVVFSGAAPKPAEAAARRFVLGGFGAAARTAVPSLAAVPWSGGEGAALDQARAILARAEAEKSGDPDQRTLREARAALSEAEGPAARGDAAGAAARRASALASEAIREALARKAAEEAARAEAEQAAKEAARRAAAADEAERRRQAEEALAEVEELRRKAAAEVEETRLAKAALAAATALAEEERARMAAKVSALEREHEAVVSRLASALAAVGPVEESPRGHVVTLPGTAFEAGRAGLTTPARVALGKLAGILLMAPDRNVRVESHTDASGSPAANRKLSEERARAVAALLREQGVAEERIAFEGYGPDLPLAPNSTADGRARNRRVEIVVGTGTIEAAPYEAPQPPG